MSSKPPSDTETVWNASNIHFQFSPTRVREFYTGAIKHLLPQSAWNDTFPPLPKSLYQHEAMIDFIRGFDGQNSTRMLQRPDELDELMRLAAIGKRSPGKKMSHRIRMRKLEALRQRIRKYLKIYFGQKPQHWQQGLVLTSVSIRRHYFPAAVPQSHREVA